MSDEKKLPELSKEAKAILDSVKTLSVLDLANLVKNMEEEFGVSAAAPVAAAAAPADGGDAGEEEKSEFDVKLIAIGDAKINVIKAVKEITGAGLKDAKDMVDGAPAIIKEKVAKAEAEELKKKLEEAGATVELA